MRENSLKGKRSVNELMKLPKPLKPGVGIKHAKKSQGPRHLYGIGLRARKKQDFRPN